MPASTKFSQPNAPKDKELAPRKELNDPNQFVILEGQVGNLIFGFPLLAPTFELQVLGRNCQGISGALVEVWYTGGELGLEKCLSSNVGKL